MRNDSDGRPVVSLGQGDFSRDIMPSDLGAAVAPEPGSVEPTLLQVVDAMRRYGGGFVSHLAEAWARADLDNERRLRQAFPEIWKRYRNMAHRDLVVQVGRKAVR